MELKDICNIIYDSHLQKLSNLDKSNKKMLFLFSGVPGSGKSFIARRLEERYHGIRINNDDIREIIINEVLPKIEGREFDVQQTLEFYLNHLLQKLPENNGFLILDSSIDRKLDLVLEYANQKGFKIFLIRIDLPKDIIVKQIKQRAERDPLKILSELDSKIEDHERIFPSISVDYSISEAGFDKFEDLFEAIDRKLSSF